MPTIDIPDRICPHCGGTKWFKRKNKKSKDGVRYVCNVRLNEIGRRYHKKRVQDPEKRNKIRERHKLWASENKDKRKASVKKYINSEKGMIVYKEKSKRNDDRKRQKLSGSYVRKTLRHHLKIDDSLITPETEQKYRAYLTALRQLKQLEKNEKEKSN